MLATCVADAQITWPWVRGTSRTFESQSQMI